MKKSCILRGHGRFRTVLSRGRRFESGLLRGVVLQSPGSGIMFGFAVPRRMFNAVTRNRIKRLMRASVAGHWSDWQELQERAGKQMEIVLYYKGSGTLLPARVQLQDIDRDLERIRNAVAEVL